MQLKRTTEFEGTFKEIFLTIPSAAGMMTHSSPSILAWQVRARALYVNKNIFTYFLTSVTNWFSLRFYLKHVLFCYLWGWNLEGFLNKLYVLQSHKKYSPSFTAFQMVLLKLFFPHISKCISISPAYERTVFLVDSSWERYNLTTNFQGFILGQSNPFVLSAQLCHCPAAWCLFQRAPCS